MSNMNILGMYSGIDMTVIDELINAEKAKGGRFTNRKIRIEEERSAWKEINSGLDAFLKRASALGDAKTFQANSVKSNVKDSSVLKVSANEKVMPGQYKVQVEQLAESARLTGVKVEAGDHLKLEGSLEINGAEIEIEKGDTLENIVTKINETEDLDVTAEIVDGGLKLKATSGKIEIGGKLAKDLGLEGSKVKNEDGVVTGTKVNVKQNLEFEGTFEIELGGKKLEIEVKESDTLRSIVNNINKKAEDEGFGARATIIENRIVINASDLGAQELKVSGELAEDLGLAGKDITTEKGQNAKFTVNGIEIERNSNMISDAVDGLTFNLTSSHTGDAFEMITVETDTDKITSSVKDFVDEYNKLMKNIEKQMDVGDPSAEDNKTGALTGDGTLMRLQSSLSLLMTGTLQDNGSGAIRQIEDLGISIDRDGVASFDEEQFRDVFREDPTNVARFFYNQERVEVPVEGAEDSETTTQLEKRGMSELFKNLIDTYVEKKTGIITAKNENFDALLKDIDEQIEVFNERVEKKRERYIQQFTAVDIALMQAESQMEYLYSQLGMWQQ